MAGILHLTHRRVASANLVRAAGASSAAGTAIGEEWNGEADEVEMDTDKTDTPIKEVLDGLFTLLETQETLNAAVLEFLKDQGIASDEKLAPYLERAASSSSVKWRAARARMTYLLAPAPKKATDQHEQPAEKPPQREAAEPKEAVSRNVGSKQDAGPREASPSDAPRKDAAAKGAGSEREPHQTETKPSEIKEPVAKIPDRAKAPETGEKAHQAKRDAPSSGAVTGGDRSHADSQQSAKGSRQVAKSKAASAGQADENDPAQKSKSQDAPAQSKE
jgi:hypothetical protein